LPVLDSRHFPQLDLSTVVAPSGGVPRTALKNEGAATALCNPAQNGTAPSHLRPDANPLFSCTCHSSLWPRLDEGESSMGCKQYARMLGLSRGYPHILYLSLNKWDAASCLRFSTRRVFSLTLAARPEPNCDASDPRLKSRLEPFDPASELRHPWPRRHPRRFHAAQFLVCRRRIRQGSRLFDRDVRVQVHPGTLTVR
jgi:hypothetical protein